MLRTRILTAVVLLALFAGVFIMLDARQFAIAMIMVGALASFEWAKLCFSGRMVPSLLFAIAITAALLVLFNNPRASTLLPFVIYSGALAWCLSPLLLVALKGRKSPPRLSALFGVVIIIPSVAAILLLRQSVNQQIIYLWILLLIVSFADIGAYFFGRAFGRHKLAPAISPGKTIEGAIGGMLSAAVVGSIALSLSPFEIKPGLFIWLGICIVTAVFSIFGDLTESLFKRMAGVKDSGTLLPGHGGILDRIDGVLAAAPVFTSMLLLTGFL
ncbi:MAG: phosphatidate cytidylyltransferase [marine bacterium B5-7]|nr:MAG: phosphatidate cytidylyltransferase [marine bacterium B5-7]